MISLIKNFGLLNVIGYGFLLTGILFRYFCFSRISLWYKEKLVNKYIKERVKITGEKVLSKILGIGEEEEKPIMYESLDIKTQKMILEWMPTQLLESDSFDPTKEEHKYLNNHMVKGMFDSHMAAKDSAKEHDLFMCKMDTIVYICYSVALTLFFVSLLRGLKVI